MLPAETMDALRANGLIQFFQPRRFGGLELEWGVQVELGREIGKACGSTAWIVAIVATHAAIAGRFPDAAQTDVWGDGSDPLIATASFRVTGEGAPVDEGYELSGAWRFSSGVDHAAWAIVSAPVVGTGVAHEWLVPRSAFEIVDDWDVVGLRGTGSKQILIEQPVFVPAHRAVPIAELMAAGPAGAAVNDSYVYRMEFGPYFGTSLLGPVLGAAEGAVADYAKAAQARTGERGADRDGRQLRFAESSAEVAFARYATERMLELVCCRAADGVPLGDEEYAQSLRDRAFATQLCLRAVQRLVQDLGASGLQRGNPVQRHFRDLTAMAAQAGLGWDRNAGAYGKWALGFETGNPRLDAARTAP